MQAYNCKIALSDGQLIERVIQSNSLNSIKKQVSADGGFLVEAQKIAGSTSLVFFRQEKVKPKEFYSFNQELLTLLRAGLPVTLAFDGIIENREKDFFSRILQSIRDDISGGESVSNAFEKYENIFSPLYTATIRSGEAGGNIPSAIEEFLEYFERSRQIRQKVVAASVYPSILTVCSVFVVIFLIVFVVPTITGTFAESGAELPFFTTILLQFSHMVRSYFLMISGAVVTLIWGGFIYLKTEQGKLFFDTYYLKLPFFGQVSVLYSTALFTASLSAVLRGGMPLNQALHISKGLVGNGFIQKGIGTAIQSVEHGDGFARSLRKAQIFPDLALRMIAAGEESGNLEKVLKDIAAFYEREIASKLSIITSTIEPLLMVLMGFIIGFIMLAMYMPIFQMAGTMG